MILLILISLYYLPTKFFLALAPIIFFTDIIINRKKLTGKYLYILIILSLYLFLVFGFRDYSIKVFLTGLYFYLFPFVFILYMKDLSASKIKKNVKYNSYLVLSQIPFLLYQFIANADFSQGILAYDWAVGSIAIGSRGGSHTPGVIMMFNFISYYHLYAMYKTKLFKYTYITSLIFWILTSTTHSYAAFMVGITLSVIFLNYKKIFIRIWPYIIALFILHYALLFTQFNAYNGMLKMINMDANIQKYGKFQLFFNSFTMMKENPDVFLFGTGLGRYNSRTAAFTSSEYFSSEIKEIYNVDKSEYFEKYLSIITQSIALRFKKVHFATIFNYSGVINKPFSSMVSVLCEFGFIGFLLYTYFFYLAFKSIMINNKYLKGESLIRFEHSFFVLLALSIFDNWVEYPKVMILFFIMTGSILSIQHYHKNKTLMLKHKNEI